MPSPLLLNHNISGEWECCLCAEKYTSAPPSSNSDPSDRPWLTIEEDLVCKNCVIKPFREAVEYDYYYPARYANQPLDFSHFSCVLPPDIQHQYLVKMRDRTYRHVDRSATVEGQERGKDYQLCPACGTSLYLEDGCSHIVCTCRAELCFVCGRYAAGDSDHWMQGGCPRWNNNDTGEVLYDGDETDDETDDEDDFDVDEDEDEPYEADDGRLYYDVLKYLQLTQLEREAEAAMATVHLHITSWGFHAAMYSSDTRTRAALTRTNHHLQGAEGNYRDYRRARTAIEAYSHLHGVSEEYWALLTWRMRQPLEPGQNDDDPWLDGFNSLFVQVADWPASGVSGVFNMVIPHIRKAAWDWIEERVGSWSKENANDSDNAAIFDIGPGGDLKMRKDAALLVTWLRPRMPRNTWVMFLENHYVIFQSMAGNALLVRGQGRELHPSALQAPSLTEETMRLMIEDEEGCLSIPTMDSRREIFENPSVLRMRNLDEEWDNVASAVDRVQLDFQTRLWELLLPNDSWEAHNDQVSEDDEGWEQWRRRR